MPTEIKTTEDAKSYLYDREIFVNTLIRPTLNGYDLIKRGGVKLASCNGDAELIALAKTIAQLIKDEQIVVF